MRKSSIVGWGALLSIALMQPVSAASGGDVPEDAAHDLAADKFYNRPGATRAQYIADWEACRLIARGAQPPSKNFPKNLGTADNSLGILPAVLNETIERRFSRNTCLLTRGWRQYSLGVTEKRRVQALSETERAAYFDRAVGAGPAPGTPYGRTDFAPSSDPMLVTEGSPALPGSFYVGREVNPKTAMVPSANEALVVLAFRRPDKGSSGRAGELQIQRYDVAKRDLAYPSSDKEDPADTTTYTQLVESIDRNARYEVQVMRLTPGDYVIAGTAVSRILLAGVHPNVNCFGAPLFHADAGQTVYIGDFTPFWGAKMSSGDWAYGIGYSRHIEDARDTLKSAQPALAAAMRQARMFNQARFTCVGGLMDRWDLPGLEALP
jgi:hypothetical protein